MPRWFLFRAESASSWEKYRYLAFARLANLEIYREAVFRFKAPFDTALSISLVAFFNKSALFASPFVIACLAFFIAERIEPIVTRLHRVRFSRCRSRLVACFELATPASIPHRLPVSISRRKQVSTNSKPYSC